MFVVSRNVLTDTWDGNFLCFPICNKERFSKYVILFNGKSIRLGHLMFTGFSKNVLILSRFICWQFVIDLCFLKFI